MVLRIGIVGTGVTATAHAIGLAGLADVALTVAAGTGPEAPQFGERFGCRIVEHLEEALALVDAVVVATPSALHAQMSLAALRARRHVLVEAPMAMSFGDGQRLVDAANDADLVFAVSHPLRLRAPLAALAFRIRRGEERLLTANAMFYMASPRAPVGLPSPGWTDNVLWHHMSHGTDLIHWLVGGSGQAAAGGMGTVEAGTGIPMRAWVSVELPDGFGLVSADYAGIGRNELLLVTDRNTYHFDQARATFADAERRFQLTPPLEHLREIARDFVEAIRSGSTPAAPGSSVLSALRSLQYVQNRWDRSHGTPSIPGRVVGA